MSYYDDDRWEFDPGGEGRIEPDPTNSSAVDDGSYERGEDSLEDDHLDYPDTPGPDSRGSDEPTEHRCECGAPLDPGRTKVGVGHSESPPVETALPTGTTSVPAQRVIEAGNPTLTREPSADR